MAQATGPVGRTRGTMGREQGRLGRFASRTFRERQIYHRADGVVRFIKLSPRTQIAMTAALGAFVAWSAYASTNTIFKEQIIVSKERDAREQEAAYRRKLQTAESAYDEVNALNYIYQREFDATVRDLRSQHDTLRALVENKSTVDSRLRALAETLQATGAPGGRQVKSGNRIMVDPAGREPTPRQSRVSTLREEALRTIMDGRIAEGIDDEVLATMRAETAELSSRQVVLMAALEEELRREIREMQRVLSHTGVGTDHVVETFRLAASAPPEGAAGGAELAALGDAGADGAFAGQGGPFIPVGAPSGADADAEALGASPTYFRTAERVAESMTDLVALSETIRALPVSAPIAEPHRQTSRFGRRRDPINRSRYAEHRGMDFAGPRNTPLLATAPGRVSFAGTRGAFGRTVEIDHGNGFKTRYAHMNKIKVRSGQQVDLHDVVGLMGTTGRSTGVHLHYEILHRAPGSRVWRQVDPQKFIEAGRYVFES